MVNMKSLNYFKALSDITRIRIYNILLHHELSVNELVLILDMGQSRISRHLKILTDSGLLKCRRNGVWAFYSADFSEVTGNFTQIIKCYFEEEPSLNQDLLRALQIIEDRSHKTKQFFNTIAHKWDLLKQDILGSFDLNSAIVESVDQCLAAADLGCGTGELISYLKKYSSRVIGVDSSSSMLGEARKRFLGENGTVDLRLGELEHLPLGDAEVDLAVISLALHHLSQPQLAISEACRILKPGGTLIIAEFDRHDNETLRKTYGDRWLGLTEKEVGSWISENSFIMSGIKTYKLQQSLTLKIYKTIKKYK